MKKIILAAIAFSFCSNVFAEGHLSITNQNNKDVDMQVISKEGKVVLEKTISANSALDIQLTTADLNNNPTYTIKGKTNILMSDECSKLDFKNNYSIVFKDDMMGTTCKVVSLDEKK